MLPITGEYGVGNTVLKFFPYKGASCVVPASMVPTADANGKKIVKAGTPFPSNDENALGVIFEDVDVTRGDAPGTYVYEGILDPAKLTANSITISDAAKAAMPNVQIYGTAYAPVEPEPGH